MQSFSQDTVNMSFLSLFFLWITSPGRRAAAPLCVWESVRVCVPLRAEKAWLRLWRVLDATAEHPGRRCVALRSAGGSAGQGLSVSSGRRRARRNRIRAVCCRSYNASLLRSLCKRWGTVTSNTGSGSHLASHFVAQNWFFPLVKYLFFSKYIRVYLYSNILYTRYYTL